MLCNTILYMNFHCNNKNLLSMHYNNNEYYITI